VPFTPAFSTEQPVGDPSVVTITDDSTGSDAAITQRRVYLQKYDESYLVPDDTDTDYIEWAWADDSIEIDALDKDYALLVIIQWLDASNVVLYTASERIGFTQYNEEFDYQLTQLQSGNPVLISDGRFFELKSLLRTEIDSGNQAISLVVDLYGAQLCYDAATAIREKASTLFSGTFN
jgi:hypothetical protein